jgi:hypothetical protein
MRKLTLFLTIAFVITCVSGLLAQTTNIGVVSINSITNLVPGDNTQLMAGKTHVVSIQYDLTGLPSVGKAGKWVVGNGWQVYSPDGAEWGNLVAHDGPIIDAMPDDAAFTRYHKYFTSSNDGVSFTAMTWIPPAPDDAPFWTEQPGGNPTAGTDPCHSRVAYSLGSFSTSAGIIGGTVGIAATIEFSTQLTDSGLTMCIDSMKAGAGWEWAPLTGNADRPRWDSDPFTAGIQSGPLCLEIFKVQNLPPVWCGAPNGEVTFNHCEQGSFTLCATDPDDPDTGPISYHFGAGFETGYGQIVGNHWTWSGGTVPHEGTVYIPIYANDTQNDSELPFTLQVNLTNNEPTISCPAGPMPVQVGKCKSQVVTIGDDVCDESMLQFEVLAGTGYDLSEVSFVKDGNEVTVTFWPLDPPKRTVTMPVQVTYPGQEPEVATCNLMWSVTVGSDYQVLIPKLEEVFQGQLVVVPVYLYAATYGLGGFDLLIAYDASALAFQKAVGGIIYNQDDDVPAGCGWEYFTYRYGPYGNCGNACPSGMLRIIGMAETNNGPYHPDCGVPAELPTTLADLTFLVSNDRTLECQFVPIRFFWYECGDNTLSNFDGSILYLEEAVYDFWSFDEDPFFEPSMISSPDSDSPFPTYTGTLQSCVCSPNDDPTCKVPAVRAVAFQNGGVDIACRNLIDDRGDINMNGLGYEIADAVMFTNYFIEGIKAFADCTGLSGPDLTLCLHRQQGAIAASDTNADGLALTVADLVYLIRVVIGDAMPYDKAIPVAASVTYGDGIFNVDAAMGAAHIVMAGEVTPTLLATNMEMKYGVLDGNTSILIYSMEPNQSFSGKFLQVEGRMISSQFATFLGQPVNADVMPANFALHQNYPNPFNPTTTIKIDVPKNASNWTLNIYNVTGQLVETMSGNQPGYQEVVWDASNNASGIYFYKLTAGDYSATKKAVLLK